MTQVMMIRLSHARDSSTVRPEREKFIIKSATDAVTMAAIFQRFGNAPVGSGNGVEHKLSVCVPDTVAVLVQLIHPALL